MLVALIMAGGSGQRFWPLSNEEHPKQLLKLFSDKTMIRESVERILPIVPRERIFIATNVKQAEDIMKELPFLPKRNIIKEPKFKDTGACIGYASIYIENILGKCNLLVLPSDHLIEDRNTFLKIIEKGEILVEKRERVVVFGISPDKPETGYGYIEADSKKIGEFAYKVNSFKEKPNLEIAKSYLEKGNYYWNSGMFMWSSETILSMIKSFMPEHWDVLEDIKKLFTEDIDMEKLSNSFDRFEKISIDYGVMENAKDVAVIPANIGWNDIGNFTALDEIFKHGGNGSVIRKENDNRVIEFHSHDNIIINNSHKKLVATLGIEDTVIVETDDILLVCKKDEAQDIKKLLEKVKEDKW